MFKTIRQRLRDMGTIKTLCFEAEKLANAEGQKEPGAEHFVLSALALPDGTARKAFLRIHTDPNNFRAAIAQQYEDALQNVGITLPQYAEISGDATPIPTSKGLYKTQSSAQVLMQTLTREIMKKEQKANSTAPLLSAHVVLAATSAQYGVTARTFHVMGIDPAKLAEAAIAEIVAYRACL
jgi:ATP-dependent Clp protease ATP-binding subunit ClpA